MVHQDKINFVLQQGFDEDAPSCGLVYPALMFQPRLVGTLAVIAIMLQSWQLFLILSVALWLSALVPEMNPFSALYNWRVAGPKGMPRLGPAPMPRRFSMGMAATFMMGIGAFLLLGWLTAAYMLQMLLLIALGSLIFGKFCLGSYIFHHLKGNGAFAKKTLPWSKGQ